MQEPFFSLVFRLALARLRLQNVRALLGIDHSFFIDTMFLKIIQEADRTLEQWGGTFYFVYFPAYPDRPNGHSKRRSIRRIEVIKSVQSLNIPVIDFYEEVIKRDPNMSSLWPFEIGGHFNRKEYEAIANAIFKTINELPAPRISEINNVIQRVYIVPRQSATKYIILHINSCLFHPRS